MAKPTNTKMISLIFWCHFTVALASHIFVPIMIGGIVSLVVGDPMLGFWIKGLLLGISFYSGMYAVNHVTNKDGFCVLTDLENYYRCAEGLPLVNEFVPRFYTQCRIISKTIHRFFKKSV